MYYEYNTFAINDTLTIACLNRITLTQTKNSPGGETHASCSREVYTNPDMLMV